MDNPPTADEKNRRLDAMAGSMHFLDENPSTLEGRQAQQEIKSARAEEMRSMRLGQPATTHDVSASAGASGPVVVKHQTAANKPDDLEFYIGQRWLPVIGIVAIILGVGYLLNYAFDAGIIPPWGRVLLGAIGGGLLVAFGEYLRSSYQRFSNILYGGGIALFYLSAYAAHASYALIGQATALALMSIITGSVAVVAVKHDAMLLAVFAEIGGYITPMMLFGGQNGPVTIFTYVAFLNIGILITSYFKGWRELNMLGIIGTIMVFAQWYDNHYIQSYLALTQFFLSVYFVEHLFALFFGCLTDAAVARKADLVLISLVSAWFYGWTYSLLNPNNHDLVGPATILLAVTFAALGWTAYVMKNHDRNFFSFLFGISTIFGILVVPIQFNANVITIGWAMEGVVIAWIGLINGSPALRMTGISVLMLSILRLLMWDSPQVITESFRIIANRRFLTYGAIILAIGALHGLYIHFRDTVKESSIDGELRIIPILGTAWAALLFALLNIELNAYFEHRAVLAVASGKWMNMRASLLAFRNSRNAFTSVLWSLYASGLLGAGVYMQNRSVRLVGLSLFAITIMKVFVIDLWDLPGIYRFLSLVVLGILLLGASYVYHRIHGKQPVA